MVKQSQAQQPTPSTSSLIPRRRRSKRKVNYVATRFSKRKLALLQQDQAIYGNDYGILPSVKASVLPGRVPLGFVCGYPLPGNGELYGGSMFSRSAAMDTLQGKAIHSINTKWGNPSTDVSALSSSSSSSAITTSITCSRAPGRETIGIPVCKKKYKPFDFHVMKQSNGVFVVQVERLYGCKCHHAQRKQVIEVHGERQGWQPFGAWSLRKAQNQARIEAARLNGVHNASNDCSSTSTADTVYNDDDNNNTDEDIPSLQHTTTVLRNICLNGTCSWKLESAYDNIYKEIHGHTESEAEDNG